MARGRLTQDLSELRTQNGQHVPELNWPMKDINIERPEKEALFLPSDYRTTAHDELKLRALTQVEYQLRKLNAYQALDTMRQAIRMLNINVGFKKAGLHGTSANTRVQNYLKTLANDVQIAGSAYRSTQGLQPLLMEHLRGKDGKAQAAGQVKESDPWLWRVGRLSTLSEEDEKNWNQELDRVKWFRLRALLERAKRSATFSTEFDHTWQSFHRTAAVWKSMAAETETEKPGQKSAQGTLPKVLANDLEKEQMKEAKEAARAKKISASPEDVEDLWETLSKTRLIDASSTDRELREASERVP
ncbi:hypothetical protein B0H13DRAFT_1886254 [Mycena leptocephala]|nr:hypothetical protein B0H13DRAFT_1886254 [Mycena leptocephala]